MTASVDVVLDKRDDVVTLPTSAVPTSGTSATVTVRGSDGKDASRSITIGLRGDSAVEITAGLNAGDQVVETSSAAGADIDGISRRRRRARRRRTRWRARPMSDTPVIALRDITKTYGESETTVHALRGVSIDIAPASTSRSWAPRAVARAP